MYKLILQKQLFEFDPVDVLRMFQHFSQVAEPKYT